MSTRFYSYLSVFLLLASVVLVGAPSVVQAQSYSVSPLEQVLADARDDLMSLLVQIKGKEEQRLVDFQCIPSVAEQVFGSIVNNSSENVNHGKLVDYVRCAIITAQRNDESLLDSLDDIRDDIDDLEDEVGDIPVIEDIADISDVSVSNPLSGQLLQFDGSNWTNVATSSLGLGGGGATATGTTGAVQFSDGSGGLSADSNNFFWDDANDRLGVRTDSPDYTFEVNNGVLGGIGGTPAANFRATDGGTAFLQSQNTQGAWKFGIDGSENFVLNDATNDILTIEDGAAADSFYLTSAGRVGIGTSTPSATLTVIGDIVANPSGTSAADFVFGSPALDYTGSTAQASRFFFDTSLGAFRAGYATSTDWNTGNIGLYSAAFGRGSIASATGSAAFGDAVASGDWSFAVGDNVQALSNSAAAFGSETRAYDFADVAFGSNTRANSNSGAAATAFGLNTSATGTGATAFGSDSQANGFAATAFGDTTVASANQSTAFGSNTEAAAFADTAFGSGTVANGGGSGQATAFGSNTTASNFAATAFGSDTTASGSQSTAFGSGTVSGGFASLAIGSNTTASNQYSFAGGANSTASGPGSFAFGTGVTANNQFTTAFGASTNATNYGATAFGTGGTASGQFATVFGAGSTASGDLSIATGNGTQATGTAAVSFGSGTIAGADYAVAFGQGIRAGGESSFAVGLDGNQSGVTVPANTAAFMGGDVGIGTVSPQRTFHVLTAADEAPVRFEDSNGYCEIDPTTTSWTCTSDERLKKDITSLNSASILASINDLRPVHFVWKSDETEAERTGLIAQEVEGVFPDLVKTDSETGFKSVSYGGFIPHILSGIQELADKVSSLFDGSGRINAKEVAADKLCVGDTCVTESELKRLLDESGEESSGGLNALEPRGEESNDDDNEEDDGDVAGTSTASSTNPDASDEDEEDETATSTDTAGTSTDSENEPEENEPEEENAATSSSSVATSSDLVATSSNEAASSTNTSN